MAKVAHLTSVHVPYDTRIFHKECTTLAQAGYEVVLVVPHERDEVAGGVRLHAVPKPTSRLRRMTATVRHIYRAAMAEHADIYHFHDPELIPVGLLLRKQGHPVVYDVHEDYVTSLKQKRYLPRLLRSPLAAGWNAAEARLTRPFQIILAERYYAARFPQGVTVLNYPIRACFADLPADGPALGVLYTGVVGQDRGALTYARIAASMEDIDVYVVGRCSSDLVDRMRGIAGEGRDRLRFDSVGSHVAYRRILHYYGLGRWIAGLAIYPPTPHYMQKEPTKLLEYMAAGIPIICSDFPAWRFLVESSGAGLCVDPLNPEAAVHAIRYLLDHPEEARRMSENGRRAFEARYNWDSEAQKLIDLYDNLTPTRRSA